MDVTKIFAKLEQHKILTIEDDRIEGTFDEEHDAIFLTPPEYETFVTLLHTGHEHELCDGYHEFLFTLEKECIREKEKDSNGKKS
jgi:hypothetical protein